MIKSRTLVFLFLYLKFILIRNKNDEIISGQYKKNGISHSKSKYDFGKLDKS